MLTRLGGAVLSGVLAFGALPAVAMGQGANDVALVLKVNKTAYRYTRDALKALATADYRSFRGDKTNRAVPLDVLLTKDTKLSLDKIARVVVIGEQKVLLLEGDNLKYLKDLVVKMGNNQLALAAMSPEVEERLRPLWGKPRVELLERIDVTPRH